MTPDSPKRGEPRRKKFKPPVYFKPSVAEKRSLVQYCPGCGARPEYAPEKVHEHIWKVNCDRCQFQGTVWVTR